MGDAVLEKLVSCGLLTKASDIYTLKKEDFMTLEGFKDKSSENLINAIENSKKNDLSKLVSPSGYVTSAKRRASCLPITSARCRR